MGGLNVQYDRKSVMAAYSAFRRGLRAATQDGAWPKLDEWERINLIVEKVKAEIYNLPIKQTWWEWLGG